MARIAVGPCLASVRTRLRLLLDVLNSPGHLLAVAPGTWVLNAQLFAGFM